MSVATVKLWGATVGYVAWYEDRNIAGFEYDSDFLTSGIELSPICMPLRPGTYEFPGLSKETFRGLPGMLADSLPDKFGNALIDQWLAETGRTPQQFNPVERLMYVGKRGMGALEYEPAVNSRNRVNSSLDISQLVTLASRILRQKQDQQYSLLSNSEGNLKQGLDQIFAVGTSAGGARAKAIIAWNEITGDVRSGQLQAEEGYSYWLLKFDGVDENKDKELADPKGYGRIEYAYYLMAKEAGIDMSECRLLEECGRAHFMTKRFDRLANGQKLHMQSLCALGHHDFNMAGATSYEQAFQACALLGLGMAAKEQLFLRMAFNVIAVNCDDHTKQISFLMNKQGQWNLSPAYDMTYAFNPNGVWTSQHQMQINQKRIEITRDDLITVGMRYGMNKSRCNKLVDRTIETVNGWQQFARQAGVIDEYYEKVRVSIESHRVE